MPGRFAPSPTGPLHVGNLRTALIAWLLARSAGDEFRLRMEDLDRVTSSPEHERAQLADLAAMGIDWDGDVWRQSERFDLYEDALGDLHRAGRTYECFCSRREIRESAAAPHGDGGLIYSGRCRRLTDRRRAELRQRRVPAVRFRADSDPIAVDDLVVGHVEGLPWDVVLRRNDGVPAYNLAVVVDDAAASIDLVARGDDLLATTPSQAAIGQALGLPSPRYAHVPLVVGADGRRLAKRDGAITLAQLAAEGVDAGAVRSALARSIGIAGVGETLPAAELVHRFDVTTLRQASSVPMFVGDLLGPLGRAQHSSPEVPETSPLHW
jgi:glutamyl-tRNA synthetase